MLSVLAYKDLLTKNLATNTIAEMVIPHLNNIMRSYLLNGYANSSFMCLGTTGATMLLSDRVTLYLLRVSNFIEQ